MVVEISRGHFVGARKAVVGGVVVASAPAPFVGVRGGVVEGVVALVRSF